VVDELFIEIRNSIESRNTPKNTPDMHWVCLCVGVNIDIIWHVSFMSTYISVAVGVQRSVMEWRA